MKPFSDYGRMHNSQLKYFTYCTILWTSASSRVTQSFWKMDVFIESPSLEGLRTKTAEPSLSLYETHNWGRRYIFIRFTTVFLLDETSTTRIRTQFSELSFRAVIQPAHDKKRKLNLKVKYSSREILKHFLHRLLEFYKRIVVVLKRL